MNKLHYRKDYRLYFPKVKINIALSFFNPPFELIKPNDWHALKEVLAILWAVVEVRLQSYCLLALPQMQQRHLIYPPLRP